MAGPAVSVLDLLTEVLSLLGVYAPGEPIDAADSASLLFTLNGLIDGLRAESLTKLATVPLTFQTVAGKGSYTLGTSGTDWVIASGFLPPAIDYYGAMIGGNLESGMDPLTDAEWAAIGLKGLASTIGLSVWPQYGVSSHTIWIWPVPSGIEPIVLYCRQPVPSFTAITDAVLLPPGYQEFLTYELTIKSAAKFGARVPDWVPPAWAAARTRVKEDNFEIIDAACDAALTSQGRRGGGSIDFYLGK
jgi:hypothetical protein